VGDTLTYTITATNAGNVTLTNVTVDDDLTGTMDAVCAASLAPNTNCSVNVMYMVQQSDVDAGEINNTGTVDSDQTAPLSAAETVPVPQNPAIGAAKALTNNADEDGTGTVSVGDTLTYTITATNAGNVTLTNVTVDDDLTGTVDAPCAASRVPNASCSVDVTYVVQQSDVEAGVINNTGTVDSDQAGPVSDPETVAVQNPVIGAAKALTANADEDVSGTVSLGDTLTYTITATNLGNVTLTNVTVDDDLTGTVDAVCAASLALSASCSVDVMYVVQQSDVEAGVINNTGTVDSDQTSPVSDPEMVPVPQNPGIGAAKALTANADEDGTLTVSVGDTLTYTITATNLGNVTLTNVTVDDDLTGTVDAVCSASLAPSASCSVDVTYVVQQSDVDAGVINNTGTVDSDQAGPVSTVHRVGLGLFLFTVDPCRIIDTRLPDGPLSGPVLVTGDDRIFTVTGTCNIPSTAKAISVNIAVTGPTAAGNLRLHPGGTPVPPTSSINYSTGQTRSNNAVVPLNDMGELAVFVGGASGTVHFILDVNGYFQ
jgi:uncharacterized repeat protein (TIGR01451 family)